MHNIVMLMFEADPAHYQLCSVLGHCCEDIATVHLARHLPSGTLVAVKKFNMDKSKEEASLIQHEIILTRQLQHPNVLPYHAAFVSGPEVVVVAPLMAFGSCKDLLSSHFTDGLPEAAVAFILRDVLQGLDYIHRKGYIHRAVRASHILVSGCGRACLSGLRYACRIVEHGRWQRSVHSFPRSTACNLNWLSPEVLEQNLHGYNEKSDVYSLGMTACELANGVVPFADMPTTLMLTEKVRGCAPQLLDHSTLPPLYEEDGGQHTALHDSGVGDSVASNMLQLKAMQQRRFSDAFHQLAELCLQREPALRPSASQLLAHSFFKQCRQRHGDASPTVPQLLHPVMPICDRRVDSQDDLASILAAEKLAELEIEPDQWDF
ncbi:STE20-related kinase adapter protein alpha isoform X2 [Periplaneta americana]|uniref:STE20-related kinase adapter protein alpha isoform X2 n=1 Tax=Periplaneta americana TaxID=6978 RepID=UPI0037E8479A